jgi:hypothetical protein
MEAERYGKRMAGWLEHVRAEGHDNYGSYELALGVAVFVSQLLLSILRESTWLTKAVLWLLLIPGLAYAQRTEWRRLYSLGRRRFRTTPLLWSTWLSLGVSLLCGYLLLEFADVRTWSWALWWRRGPLMLLLTLGGWFASLGVKARVRRWVLLGLVLSAWAVLIPFVPFLRARFHFSTALLAGGALLLSGYCGYARYLEHLQAANTFDSLHRPLT